jgi:hypothetical protein
MQYALPCAALGAAAERLARLAAAHGDALRGREVEIKLVGESRRALLGANHHPCACVNVYWQLRDDEAHLLDGLERELQALGGAPHAGKLHPSCRQPRPAPQLARFGEVVAALDPAGVFGGLRGIGWPG